MAVINKPSQPLIPPTDVEEVEEIATNVAEAAIAADDTHAPLVDDKVPAEHLPSYVDDVLNFDSAEDFPEEGEDGKIYVANDTNLTYRWSGVAYIQVGGASLAPGDGINIENDFVSVDEDYLNAHLDFAKEDDIPSNEEIANIAREQVPTFSDGLAYDAGSHLVAVDTTALENDLCFARGVTLQVIPEGESEEGLPYGHVTAEQYTMLNQYPGVLKLVIDGMAITMDFNGAAEGVYMYTQPVVQGDAVLLVLTVNSDFSWNLASTVLATKADAVELGTAIARVDSTKQNKIEDLEDIRSGAQAGASAVQPAALSAKQDTLVSGTNIKSINGQSILGSGDLEIALSQSAEMEVQSMIDAAIGNVLNEDF